MATGDFVAVQDADLEYDPVDLKRLLIPLVQGDFYLLVFIEYSISGIIWVIAS